MNFIKTQPDKKFTIEKVRNRKLNWGVTALRLSYTAEIGYIETFKGRQVEATKPLQNTLTIELCNVYSGVPINKPKKFYNQFSFEISYNCFGYCFVDSKVFLNDASGFILDEYEEVESKDAEIILFKEFQGINDIGEKIFISIHAVKILPNGNVSFKPGINPLVENVTRGRAIDKYNFNHEIYLKKK